MKKEVSAGVIVYRRDMLTHEPLFLILHYISGHWDFAKGKLENQEFKPDFVVDTDLLPEDLPDMEDSSSSDDSMKNFVW